jgi:glycosyltransferase involved in cell wall biosynthesis
MSKIFYISNSRLENSVNAVYIKGLEENGFTVEGQYMPKGFRNCFKLAGFSNRIGKNYNLIMVGYDSPWLAVVSKLLSRKKVVYNALCSVYERMIISRNLASKYSLKSFNYWLSDFLAVHLSDIVMVETNEQARFFKKMFKVSGKKLFRAWIGVNEGNFYHNPAIKKFDTFTVLFRGAFMPESGIEYAIRAAKILENENINFVIQGGGLNTDKVENLISELKPKNVKLSTDYTSFEDLRMIMQRCHLSLGQLSNHERLERTIPHKAYESLAMKLPYLTAANKAVFELFKEGDTCITCQASDVDSLSKKILWASKNLDVIESIANAGHELYRKELNIKVLGLKLKARLLSN